MPALTTNHNYVVTITKGSSQTIQANANAKLNIKLENRWVNVLEAMGIGGGDMSTGAGKLLSNFANTAQILSGSNFLPDIATSHVWRGSSGIDVSLQLRFDAWDDPSIDVLKPVQQLIQIFAPYRSDIASTNNAAGLAGDVQVLANLYKRVTGQNAGQLFLHPPGPTPYEYLQNTAANDLITASLGRVMHIGNLIPVSFDWDFEDRFTAAGDPVVANVNLSFMTYTTPTRDDILSYFFNVVS